MSHPQTFSEPPGPSQDPLSQDSSTPTTQPSYVKLAMRNMVRKRGKSLYHLALSTVALLGVLVGLAYLTR
ncbi:MAG: DUF3285 domain-containing protein [Leptolyngbyaceae cyanobacterium CRU_2_3]|nr:DUF3285 domain-containing protein [Leptolyngbyaceae cyanobacterium CRU_2_3]